MNESQIQSAIRKRLGREPDLVLWRLSQGGVVEREGEPRYRAGLSVNGGSDLIGVLRMRLASCEDGAPDFYTVDYDAEWLTTVGRFIALEVKTPVHLARIRSAIARGATSKLSDSDQAQILFLGVVRRHGGFGAFVDSEDAAVQALERARSGEFE